MTDGQYRALVAYMNFWTPGDRSKSLTAAMTDIGITDSREGVINDLFKAGWNFDEVTGLIFEDGEVRDD